MQRVSAGRAVVFGVIVVLLPGAGAGGIVWLTASYAVSELFLLMPGVRPRSHRAPTAKEGRSDGTATDLVASEHGGRQGLRRIPE